MADDGEMGRMGVGLPGHTAELLQGLCSRNGPLHWVLYEEDTQKRVRLCQPSPHVAEHTLHADHSSPEAESTEEEGLGKGWEDTGERGGEGKERAVANYHAGCSLRGQIEKGLWYYKDAIRALPSILGNTSFKGQHFLTDA